MPSRLEVICGCMFSGKSEEVIRRIRRQEYAGRQVLVVKPREDDRTEAFIASRVKRPDGTTEIVNRWDAHVIGTADELWQLLKGHPCDTLVIDEAQFFSGGFADMIRSILYENRFRDFLVIVAGLDQDYLQQPFGPMGAILCIADDITKLSAVCMRCKAPFARHTQRLKGGTEQKQTGDAASYEARCRECHEPASLENEHRPL